jgi:23S rRNA (adenine2030-N6)-methyltransferase
MRPVFACGHSMLSYRHAFHAGNYADILKHLVLVNTLGYVTRKPAPLLYVDTHAGAGLYWLQGEMARKTGEAESGILRLVRASKSQPALPDLSAYLAAAAPFLEKHQYPGSPLLAAASLRPTDRLCCFERHSSDFPLLQQTFARDRRVQLDMADGYTAARSLIPPIQKRAVVLVDPSYELAEDFEQVVTFALSIWQRMPGCHLLIWYPVVHRARTERMISAIIRHGLRDLWRFELGIAADLEGHGMTASGLLALNPPWTLPAQLRASLPFIQGCLAAEGHWRVECLVPE